MASPVKDGGTAPRGASSSIRAAGLISSLTLLSRLLGVVREQVFAALLGAGLHADAFQIAFRIPNLLRDLFAEGALSAAFVPTYTRTLTEQGPAAAHRLASRLLTFLAVALGLVVLAGIAGAWPLVARLAPGFDVVPGKAQLTVRLTRLMMPFLPLVSFAAVAMGMLNAEERFGLPAFAPATFNVVAIVWGALLWRLGLPLEQVAFGWALGTLLAGATQFAIQIPGLRALGWRFRPEWTPADPGLRRIGALMAPATVGLAAVQINIFVNSYFASYEQGAVACLSYAFRILYLPIGIFGVAVGTVATSGLARHAAVGDMAGLRRTLRQSLSMLAFLTIPATAGLLVLGTPIVRLLYERGAFAAQGDATARTAAALVYYSLGLVAYTGVKVLAPAFYALGAPRVPLLASAAAVATNLIVNVAFYRSFGFRSVALGTSLGAWVNAAVLTFGLRRRLGPAEEPAAGGGFGRMILASLGMALVAWGSLALVESRFGHRGLLAQLVTGLVPVVVGIAGYGAAAVALRIPEAAALGAALARIRRSSAP
ncbi:MAG: murein biosynthesis integral membrane protein MurJ [Vicinamibacteria bacterium]